VKSYLLETSSRACFEAQAGLLVVPDLNLQWSFPPFPAFSSGQAIGQGHSVRYSLKLLYTFQLQAEILG
jgi:hypothetical protein